MNFILRVKSAGKKPWKSQYLYYLLAASDSQIEIAQTLTKPVAMEDDARMHRARNVSLKPGYNLALLDGHCCSQRTHGC